MNTVIKIFLVNKNFPFFLPTKNIFGEQYFPFFLPTKERVVNPTVSNSHLLLDNKVWAPIKEKDVADEQQGNTFDFIFL